MLHSVVPILFKYNILLENRMKKIVLIIFLSIVTKVCAAMDPTDSTSIRNIALSKHIEVSASSWVNQNEAPEKACDGDKNTKWCDNKSEDKWLMYDLQLESD